MMSIAMLTSFTNTPVLEDKKDNWVYDLKKVNNLIGIKNITYANPCNNGVLTIESYDFPGVSYNRTVLQTVDWLSNGVYLTNINYINVPPTTQAGSNMSLYTIVYGTSYDCSSQLLGVRLEWWVGY